MRNGSDQPTPVHNLIRVIVLRWENRRWIFPRSHSWEMVLWQMYTAKARIRLRMRAIWSGPSPYTYRIIVYMYSRIYRRFRAGPDQNAQIQRHIEKLIWETKKGRSKQHICNCIYKRKSGINRHAEPPWNGQKNNIQSNLNSSNTDGSFTMDNSNWFLRPYEILHKAQENKYLGKFSYFIMKLYVWCTHLFEKLPISRINFHGPKVVRAISVYNI